MKQWIDRNWNLLFHRSKCGYFEFKNHIPEYNDIMLINGVDVGRCLGKGWVRFKSSKMAMIEKLKP